MARGDERVKDERRRLDHGEEIRPAKDNESRSGDNTNNPLSILQQFTAKDSARYLHDPHGRALEKQVYTLMERHAYTLSERHTPRHALRPVTSSTSDGSLDGYGVPCDAAYSCVMTGQPESTAAVASGLGDVRHAVKKIDCWYDELTYGHIFFTASYFHSTKKWVFYGKKQMCRPRIKVKL